MNINTINNTNFGAKGKSCACYKLISGKTLALNIIKDNKTNNVHSLEYQLQNRQIDDIRPLKYCKKSSSTGLTKDTITSFLEDMKSTAKENIDFLVDFVKVICSK